MSRYPDAFLNHWSDVYVELGVRDIGLSLEQFLANPRAGVARAERQQAMRLAVRHRAAAADPLDADDPATEVRDGRLVEKLRHGAKSQRPTAFAQRLAHKLRRVLA